MMKLTIFTPTYNRAELLKRVYRSLVNQTVKDFVWLIVDDGSTDNTKSVVDEFISENIIEIRYEYQNNGGKMRAHNTGSRLCDTELFVCLDSDDIFAPDAVWSILELWNKDPKETDSCAGIVAYKGETEGDIEKSDARPFRGALFPEVLIAERKSTLKNLYRKGFFGETTLVFRTTLLKKYQFPEIDGEKYVPEDYIYDKIDAECPLCILPKILTVCELMEGGYTDAAKRLRKENPTGWFMYYEQRSKTEPWSLLKIKYLSHYRRFAKILNKPCDLSLLEWIISTPGVMALTVLNKT